MLNGLATGSGCRCDGGLKTGRDVVVAALLGAEEFGFATAPLVVAGCVMMRVCHLDTCPVGIATQNPVLRERYTGKPEFVETFFLFLAEQVREYLAALGSGPSTRPSATPSCWTSSRPSRTTGRTGSTWRRCLHVADVDAGPLVHRAGAATTCLDTLDARLIAGGGARSRTRSRSGSRCTIRNVDRTAGTMLGSEVTRRFGPDGLPPDTITDPFTGTAGQSLRRVPAAAASRCTCTATPTTTWPRAFPAAASSSGRADDSPARRRESQVIAGNTIGYGATSGELYLRGRVGERFAVRNSGALMVAEGAGDHAL